MIDEAEESLVAAVESREAPLAVYADWLEDRGDERAIGMRWLADHDRRPRFDRRHELTERVTSRGTYSSRYTAESARTWQWHLSGELFMRNQLPSVELTDHFKCDTRWGFAQFASFADALDAASLAIAAAIHEGCLS